MLTHTVFGKGSLLSSCLGLGRAGGRVAAACELRQSRQLLLASPGVHIMREKSRQPERAECLRLPRHPSQQPRTQQVGGILSPGVPLGCRDDPTWQRGVPTRGF